MTIAERINLHKCGYTRAEIDALAKEEKETPAPEPEKETPAPAPASVPEPDPVLEAIKGLTAAIQASNIHKDEQPAEKPQSMTDLINQL